ncbi:hypothetical protein [Lentiprolixibacter aurantiacus]|uniref:Secreted protein n=1 Tax=Lentiprolixibacter aurantiacus TaxID=2993939 RepID=A0AAE3MKM4_9FLAO|nr:hypothetical protein [Lentiprolixibacter aurantiacus]MCX2719411.1 hypothetical protein [Lentiprolixibacter aurantiacus]
MRKIASILVVVLFSIGLVSCEAESTAEDQILYEVGTDGDDIPVSEREGTDGDDIPVSEREGTDGDDIPVSERE